tara:strand:+ start:25001 stop:25390 length:390 start_codon:yes stop_codon:yes gene_type:complete
MIIKDISIENLRNYSVEILSSTFLQLRQNVTEEDIVALSLILAEDLKEDFSKLHIEDINKAFRLGIRNTDDFLIGPKVWYKWIKKHRDLIWSEQYKEIQYQDKRLNYRKKLGTGMKSIATTINKLSYEK